MQLTNPNDEPALTHRLKSWLEVYSDTVPAGSTILLAVSGGSDSLALLRLMSAFAPDVGLTLYVATVDHALRPEAAEEAKRVAAICSDLDLPHTVLRLEWPEGASVSQADARSARYRVLCEHARKMGAGCIATGHTLDDQLETVFMRLRAGTYGVGLAGMAEVSSVPSWPYGRGLKLIRPFLASERAELRAYLALLNQAWVDDPSNDLDKFERVRTRRLLAGRGKLKSYLLGLSSKTAEIRSEQDAILRIWAKRHLEWGYANSVSFGADALRGLPEAISLRLLSLLLTCVSGKPLLPRSDRVLKLLAMQQPVKTTLHGCFIARDESSWLIAPEPAPAQGKGRIRLDGGTTSVWEGRSEVIASPDVETRLGHWAEKQVPDRLRETALPEFEIRRVMPVWEDGDGRVIVVPELEESSSIKVNNLGESRFHAFVTGKAEFFTRESRRRESFSGPTSPML